MTDSGRTRRASRAADGMSLARRLWQAKAARVSVVIAAFVAAWGAVVACQGGKVEATESAGQAWIAEGVSEAPTAFWWGVELTGDGVTALLNQHSARLTSIQVTNGTSPPQFTVTMVPNSGAYAKEWWWFPDLTLAQLNMNALLLNARVTNMDSWVVNGVTHHAAILISNTGMDYQPSWVVDDLSGTALASFISTNSARLVDWRQYSKNNVTMNAGVLVSNTGSAGMPWWFYPGINQTQLQSYLSTNNAMLVSLQIVDENAGTFNVVMNQNNGVGPVTWYWGKTDAQIKSLMNMNLQRMVDTKTYRVNGTLLYTTILAPNVAYSGTLASEATCDNTVTSLWENTPQAVGLGSPTTTSAFDTQVLGFLKEYGLPGGSIAVVRNGKLVLARGYGLSDKQGVQIPHPDNLFRLASLSKGITSAAVLVAWQNGLLTLDNTYPFRILGLPANPAATTSSPIPSQLNNITVRQLLNHTGGFSRECGSSCTISVPTAAPTADAPLNGTSCGATCDPMAADLFQIEGLPGNSDPPTCDQMIQYMMTQPLKWTPGQVMDYSNFGYCVLQATLEKVTGTPYATWVAAKVLDPAGAQNGIIPGHTITPADHEVRYYDPSYPIRSIYDTAGLCQNSGQASANVFCVPVAYGGAGPTATGDIEAALPQGGWLATPVDLLRLQVAKDGRNGGTPLFTAASIAALESNPSVWTANIPAGSATMTLTSPSSSFYYGFGFNVEPNASWQNVGDFNGTITHEYRGGTTVSSDPAAGFGWSALFNGTPNDPTNSVGYQIGNMMQTAFSNAGGQTGAWVNANLFDQYGVYTGWMTASAYQTYFNAQAAKSLYPSRVEGRNDTGQPMFRAYFAPFHGTAWQSNHGLDCLTYQSTAASMAAEGYQTASLQSYVGANGLRGYQATWVKW